MGVLGESSVVLIPAVHKPFGAVTQEFSPLKGFGASPPERIGVCGEYDYNGLARRVEYCFQTSVSEDVSQIRVRQRGCVVILTGAIASPSLLSRLVDLAIKVEGAALVEIYRMRFTEDALVTAEVAA
ncbi:MAG: hypothetical protein AAFQ63_14640 [Cyanobacteria bacterium J06621_11]